MSLPDDLSDQVLLGKYRLLERIGAGGMAEVYLGRHEKLDRDVAIKVLRPTLIDDPEFTARFEREARLAANLRHPGIVQVFDFDTQGDRYFLVMEYIRGGTLKESLLSLEKTGEFMPLEQVASYLTQIADALDYAHDQGMLHRDLKPANILVDAAGNTYLADFGIARLAGDPEITSTGTIMGTPAYMSPEQCEDLPLTRASDLYSLGIILFEMLAGDVPFDAESPLAVLHKHVKDPLPPLENYRQGLPQGLDSFLQTALAKDPAKRFATASIMAAEFRQVLNLPRDAPRPSVSTGVQASGTVKMDKNNQPTAKKMNTWWIAGVFFVVILVVVGLLIWFSRQTNLVDIRRCASVSTCQSAAQLLQKANRPVLAVEAYNKAISLVPIDEQPAWAKLNCDQADIYVQLKRMTDAKASYKDCIAWTHNDANLALLRQYAQQKIKSIK